MEIKSSRYLTTSFNPPTPKQQEEEELEFDESDVVWSSPEKTTTAISAGIPVISVTSTSAAGLSAALLSTGEPQSPTSIQRKTTSSPVSMISSSLKRGDGPGLTGYYYGRKVHQSAPVNVPVWPTGLGRSRRAFELAQFDEVDDFIDDYDDDDDREMVPPHEIVAQSCKTTSFSVVEGAGRTLKGRDLTTVRNAVFHKTGFLK